jgi:hypothetical protein
MQLYLHVLLLEEKDKERGRKRWTFLAVKAQRGGEANKTTAKKCELLLISEVSKNILILLKNI